MSDQRIPDQADGGATISEIGQQPDAWRGSPPPPSARPPTSSSPSLLQRSGLRIVLTGAGSSGIHRK